MGEDLLNCFQLSRLLISINCIVNIIEMLCLRMQFDWMRLRQAIGGMYYYVWRKTRPQRRFFFQWKSLVVCPLGQLLANKWINKWPPSFEYHRRRKIIQRERESEMNKRHNKSKNIKTSGSFANDRGTYLHVYAVHTLDELRVPLITSCHSSFIVSLFFLSRHACV